MLLLISSGLFAQTATAPSTGDGSRSNPYQIASLDNLYWIAKNPTRWSLSYIQIADIDASTTSGWFSGSGWTPIGDSSTQFTGTYDGKGRTINGLTINRGGTNYVGLFGWIGESGYVTVGLKNVNVVGTDFVGGIAGYIIGYVSSSHSTCSVTGGSYVGGLIGCNSDGDVYASYSNSSVSGNDYVGGLVGLNAYSNSNIGIVDECYSTGSVIGDVYVGGLAGCNFWGYIADSYSTGSVTGRPGLGGLVGYSSHGITDNSFWDMQTSGQAISEGGTGKTTAEMKTWATFTSVGWNFSPEWAINSSINNGYPYLASNIPTSVERVSIITPNAFSLLQNYPNPFNPSTNISFSLPSRLFVSLKVFDLTGREVATIVSEEMPAGSYSRHWNAARIASGIYFYHLQAGSYSETKKLVLLR
jgi:hypothetical protein